MIPLLYIFGLVVLILLQTTLLHEASIAGIKPDLALVVVYFLGLFGGEVRGFWTGLGTGYLMDLMSGGVWGIHLITKSILGYVAGLLGRTFINVKVIFTGITIAFCSLVQGLIFVIVSYFISDPEDLLLLLSRVVLPQAIYDGVLGSGLFLILSGRFHPKQIMAQGWLKSELPFLSSGRNQRAQK